VNAVAFGLIQWLIASTTFKKSRACNEGMVWFKESLSAIEAAEIDDLDDEREMIEHILLFVEQKGAEEARIAADIDSLTAGAAQAPSKRLVGDIHEVLGFLARLSRQLGQELHLPELDTLVGRWEQLLTAVQKASLPPAALQSEAHRLFRELFADLDAIKGLLAARHERVLGFIAETRVHSSSIPESGAPHIVDNDHVDAGL
jgi:hypothetical protein